MLQETAKSNVEYLQFKLNFKDYQSVRQKLRICNLPVLELSPLGVRRDTALPPISSCWENTIVRTLKCASPFSIFYCIIDFIGLITAFPMQIDKTESGFPSFFIIHIYISSGWYCRIALVRTIWSLQGLQNKVSHIRHLSRIILIHLIYYFSS